MSRKSYLILMSPTSFDPCKHVTKADFKYLPLGGFSLLFVGIRLVSWVHCRNPTSPHSALSLMSKWRPSSTRFALRPRALARALRHLTGRTTATLFKFFPMDVCFFSAHSSCIARFWPQNFRGAPQGWGILWLLIRCSHWTDWGSRWLVLQHHSHLFNHAFNSSPSFR